MLLNVVLIAFGLIAQGFTLWLLDQQWLWGALLIDIVAAMILSLSLWRCLPLNYREPRLTSLSFFGVLLAVAPGIATLGLSVIVIALCFPKKDQNEVYQSYQIPELPFTPLTVSEHPSYSIAGIQAVIKHAGESNKRLAAVMATRNMSDEQAVPILRLALSDLSDDVRLLAYSFLDGKENRLNQKIAENEKLLVETSEPELKAYYQQKIAQSFWELSYLGLAQGALRDYVLAKAADYLSQSIQLVPSNIKVLFLGRIYLANGKLALARIQFLEAMKQGLAKRRVHPYLAEVAFAEQNYPLCRDYLQQLPINGMSAQLQQIREYWCD